LLAVELLEEEVLLDLEPEILQRQRVLDHIVRHPLVELGLDHQIRPETDLEVLGGLPERLGGYLAGGGTHLTLSSVIGPWSSVPFSSGGSLGSLLGVTSVARAPGDSPGSARMQNDQRARPRTHD